jgi:hypothetical protein
MTWAAADRRGVSSGNHPANRGRAGWYGDPEGHSEAARRGWEERGGGPYRDDDDERRHSRARRDYDDDRRR